MSRDMDDVAEALKNLLELPNAERPYEELARRYAAMGMESEREALIFLIGRRFGGKLADGADPREEQREDD